MTSQHIDRRHVAVVAPSTPAALIGPAVHAQAMRRIRDKFQLPPVEYPSVRESLPARERAADINVASSRGDCAAIFAVVGGNDSITLLKHLDPDALAASRVPFVGYSDNTAICNFLWKLGRTSFYGGSTQVQLGAGPSVDQMHAASLKKVLAGTGSLELARPADYEVRGHDWQSPIALTEGGLRAPYPDYLWDGEARIVTGRSWGGCVQTLLQLAIMNELPSPDQLCGAILFFELSDEHLGEGNVLKFVRAFGEAGYFDVVGAVLFGLPPHSRDGGQIIHDDEQRLAPDPAEATAFLGAISAEIGRYQPGLPRVLGLPIGHLRPQYVIPYGGKIEVDAVNRKVTAFYDAL
ncbi:LD-carboxypeptidase [Trueperella bialowiezensis]|nr:LD-carboxypeptidase [Trueperella bialowiezensis]